MARLYTDSCGDHYDAATAFLKWDFVGDLLVVSGIAGMTGNCIQMQTPGGQSPFYARKNLPGNSTTLIAGMRVRPITLPILNSKPIMAWWDTGNMQIAFYLNSAGAISAWVGDNSGQPDNPQGTMIVTTAGGLIRPSTNFYFECAVTFAHSSPTGVVTIRVNSQVVASVSSVITGNVSDSANQISIMPGDANNWQGVYFDDIYINDETTPQNNGFDGDQQVLAFFPSGPGASTQWAIGGSIPAATNWQSVNENVPNGDVTYVSAGNVGLVDLYTIPALPASVVSVPAVQIVLDSKTDSAGLGSGAETAPVIGDGVHTPSVGTPVSQNTDYSYTLQNYGLNPLTGVAWTQADFNTLQIGQKRTA